MLFYRSNDPSINLYPIVTKGNIYNHLPLSSTSSDEIGMICGSLKMASTDEILRTKGYRSVMVPGNLEQAIVMSSFGYQLGPLIHNAKLEDLFSPDKNALIDFFDMKSKEIHRQAGVRVSRKTGGPYEAHARDMLSIYLKLAKRLDIEPKYGDVAAIIFHDCLENDVEVQKKFKAFKQAVRNTAMG